MTIIMTITIITIIIINIHLSKLFLISLFYIPNYKQMLLPSTSCPSQNRILSCPFLVNHKFKLNNITLF